MNYFIAKVNRSLFKFISIIISGKGLFPNQWFGLNLRWPFSNYVSTCWRSVQQSPLWQDHKIAGLHHNHPKLSSPAAEPPDINREMSKFSESILGCMETCQGISYLWAIIPPTVLNGFLPSLTILSDTSMSVSFVTFVLSFLHLLPRRPQLGGLFKNLKQNIRVKQINSKFQPCVMSLLYSVLNVTAVVFNVSQNSKNKPECLQPPAPGLALLFTRNTIHWCWRNILRRGGKTCLSLACEETQY